MEVESFKLTDFNIKGQIKLDNKLGLIKIMRVDDGTLSLVTDANYGIIEYNEPSAAKFAKADSILGFVLDIGIRREKILSRGHGFYFGTRLITPQSQKEVSQKDFNEELFEKISSIINEYYQSGDKYKETEAIKLQLLFDSYNNARLLSPNFYAESYLSLMQIIDAANPKIGSYNFATFAAKVSSSLNQHIYNKLCAVEAYSERLEIAIDLFNKIQHVAEQKKIKYYNEVAKFDNAGKVIFSCFFSAYQYRNKFVHAGFPFPDTVKDSIGLAEDRGTAYLNPALGISWPKIHRPDGIHDGDLIDIHQVVPEGDAANFKDKYFKLLPTWYFLKKLTREVLLNEINSK